VATDEFLKENGYTGMEYALYLMHFSELSYKGQAVFKMANFVASPKVWDLFTTWKEKRPREIKQRCILQREKYANFISTGYPKKRVLMSNMAELASPVLVEIALQERKGGNEIWKEVLDKYAFNAYMCILGCPEYLWFCPALEKDLRKGEESELRRKINVTDGATAPSSTP
jgi:hypothetical protein